MNDLLKPIYIGNILIDPPLFLAPMAGQTNHAFRTICRQQGGLGLVCTELISSHALQHKGSRLRSLEMFDWMDDERPVAVQLFGSDPAQMAEAAQMVVEHGADIVDINMGCWVPKITKGGAGAALMRDICTATAVVQAVVDAVDVPVTVKIRAGWSADNPTCIPFARAAEDAGVKAIAVHARFATQGHSGEADWDWIRKVKEVVKHIPVIGNGDIWTGEDAKRMIETTGCDGVMVGRGALGNPWVFKHIHHYLLTGETLPAPTMRERALMAQYHARYTIETTHMPEGKAIRELRGQLLKYTEGMFYATVVRDGIHRAETLEALERAFAPVLEMETA
ncbi:MAG: tRNA dihydrouridine synthase DusB [bacterium]|nr:tRNA dihydrouridine synthase DusB [bacterium]